MEAMTVICRIYYDSVQGRMLIVWLRRFHQPKRRAVRFRRIMALASWRVAVPVTIQDSTIRVAHQAGFLMSYPIAHFSMIPIAVLVLICAHAWFPEAAESNVALGVQIALLLGFFTIVLLALIRRRGFLSLRDNLAAN